MARTKQVRGKKKRWLQIVAPKSFNHQPLGETLIYEPEQALAKSITQSLMILLDDPRKQSYTIRFDVVDVKDSRAITQVIGMSMTPSAEKRLIRRHRNKVTDSFVMKIAGGRRIRVKPMLITRTRASKAAQKEIRKKTKEKLRDAWAKMRFDDIIHDIIEMKVQKHLKDFCSKTHPIRTADIRNIAVVPESREVTEELAKKIEAEASEEAARREKLQEAAEKASVDSKNSE